MSSTAPIPSPLPLPVASLLRRVRNAKSPKERHDSAYFAWEASVRLAVAARPPADASALAMPSTGQWIAAGSWAEEVLQDPALIEVRALFSEIATGTASRPRGVTARSVLEHLAAYRNAVIGHGAAREAAFYERACVALEAGLVAAWEHAVFWPAGTRLVFADTVEVDAGGARRARLMDASGLATTLLDGAAAIDAAVLPSRLYARRGDAMTPLHPWLVLQESELRDAVLFFNGQKKTAHYLDYVSGESVKAKDLARSPALDADVAGALRRAQLAEVAAPEPDAADRFGDYRLLGKLGEGGMGVVYLARQESLGRLVALKMLPAALADDAVAVARFRREMAALARCDHPNVVKILASGQIASTHYYAMELIEGADLAEVSRALSTTKELDAAVSSASERARAAKPEMFADVAQSAAVPAPESRPRGSADRVWQLARLFRDGARALQALHDAAIIHRDIKPANLMVTSADHRLVIMDLGLALLGDASRSLTRDKGALLGTLRYMPPEQLQRNLLEVDGRADIYSLGATFYELLAGRPAFAGDSEAQLVQQVLREAPLSAARANPEVPRDLSLILAKCLEKDARLRYPSAEALARDLDAFLDGRPISARAPTVGYLLQLAIRRNKPFAAAVAALLGLGLAGLVFLQWREQAHRAELRANYARALMEQGRQKLLDGTPQQAMAFLAEAYRLRPEDEITRVLVAQAASALEAEVAAVRADAPVVQALALAGGHTLATLDEGGAAVLWELDPGSRGGRRIATLPGQTWLAPSPDGARWAASGSDGSIRVLDARTGAELLRWVAHPGGVRSLAWATGAQRIVSVGATDSLAQAWSAATGALEGRVALAPFGVDTWTTDLVGVSAPISTEGTRLVATSGGRAAIFDVVNGRKLEEESLAAGPLVAATASRDASIVTAASQAVVALWRPGERAPARTFAPDLDLTLVAELDAAGDLVLATGDRDARVWDVPRQKPLGAPRRHDERVTAARWLDGERLVTADDAGRVTLWDGRALRPLAAFETPLPIHQLFPSSPPGHLAGVAGRAVVVWTLPRPALAIAAYRDVEPEDVELGVDAFGEIAAVDAEGSQYRRAMFSPDGRTIVTTQPRGPEVGRWSESGARIEQLRGAEPLGWVGTDRDERTLLLATASRVEARDLSTGARVASLAVPAPIRWADLSRDRRRWLLAFADRLELRDAGGGRVATLELPGAAGGFSRSGTSFAVAAATGCGAFDAEAGERRSWGEAAHAIPRDAWVAQDLRRLACAWSDGGELRDESGRLLARLALPDGAAVPWFAISPDEAKLLAPAGRRGAAVWDVATGNLVAALPGHREDVLDGAFGPSGQIVATASEDGTVRAFETATGALLATFVGDRGMVKSVRFSPDGRRLVAAAELAHVWELPHETRSPGVVSALARRVPWRLEGGRLLWRAPDAGAASF